MGYENIEINYCNFTIGPLTGTFSTIDTSNVNTLLVIKNSDGDFVRSINFSVNYDVNHIIDKLIYIGPTNLLYIHDNVRFIVSYFKNNYLFIDKFKFDYNNDILVLYNTLSIPTTYSEYCFSSGNLCINYTNCTLSDNVSYGDEFIKINCNVSIGDNLVIGPSSHNSYLGGIEYVTVIDIDDDKIYVYSEDYDTYGISLSYLNGDFVGVYSTIYVVSDYDRFNNYNGSIIKINYNTGYVEGIIENGIYNNVSAIGYSVRYNNCISIVKNQQLLYVDVDTYDVYRSCRLNVVKPDNMTCVKVCDLCFTEDSVYRLQNEIVLKDDYNNKTVVQFNSYNYQVDPIDSYIDVVNIVPSNFLLSNNSSTNIKCNVVDQYGIGVPYIDVFYKALNNDKGYFDNNFCTTDIQGNCSVIYNSGWFDPNVFSISKLVENISVEVYGGNSTTGSTVVYSKCDITIFSKYVVNNGIGIDVLLQISDIKDTLGVLLLYDLKSTLFFNTIDKFSSFIILSNEEYKSSLLFLNELQECGGEVKLSEKNTLKDYVCISNNYISRHFPKDYNNVSTYINQFVFIIDAIPSPFSSKNSTNGFLWVRIAPYGFSLDKYTLVLHIREYNSYFDSGYKSYDINSENINIIEFEDTSGLLGLELTYNGDKFSYGSIIYVHIYVKDKSTVPNIIEVNYWFKIIDDLVLPLIDVIYPVNEQIISTNTVAIRFNVVDNGVGVDIASLNVYVNEQRVGYTYENYDNNTYNVVTNYITLLYSQTIKVTVVVSDFSGNENMHSWIFKVSDNDNSYVDSTSVYPEPCSNLVPSRISNIKYTIVDNGSGIDVDNIRVIVDNKYHNFTLNKYIRLIN